MFFRKKKQAPVSVVPSQVDERSDISEINHNEIASMSMSQIEEECRRMYFENKHRSPEHSHRYHALLNRYLEIQHEHTERLYQELLEEDERQAEEAKSFNPKPVVTRYEGGEFIEYDGLPPIPRRHVESITITNAGGAPIKKRRMHYIPWLTRLNAYAQPAEVTITMSSGAKHLLTCNRHQVTILHEALTKAWMGETDA